MLKREDGLEKVFWPFYILALIPALVSTILSRHQGIVNLLYFVLFFILWAVLFLLAWIFLVWLMSLTVDLNKPVKENHPVARGIILHFLGMICRVGRLRIHTTGWENIPDGRFLLVGNHRSNFDPIVIIWSLRRRGVDLAFVTKAENMKIPLVRYIHMANFLVIDREDPRKAIATINEAADLLKNDVVSMGVYPEGTRNKGKGLLPFHNAVFKIAQKAKVPVVVATLKGTQLVHERAPWKHTDISLHFCACIPKEEVAALSTKDLGEAVRQALEKDLADGN